MLLLSRVIFTKPLIFTKQEIEQFARAAMLNEEEVIILQTRAAGWSRVRQADYLCISIATLDRRIADLKRKYAITEQEKSRNESGLKD